MLQLHARKNNNEEIGAGGIMQSSETQREIRQKDTPELTFEEASSVHETHTIASFIGLRMWGFAFIRAWVYLMFLGIGVGILSFFANSYSSSVYLWSSAALCVTLFSGAFAPEQIEHVLNGLQGIILALILTVIGTLLVVFAAWAGTAQEVFISLGGAATGIGSGLIHLGYGELHRDRPPTEVGIEVPMAALVAAILFALVSMLPFSVQVVSVTLLPIASGVILILAGRPALRPRARKLGEPNLILPTPRLIVRIGLCACGIGIADGIARQVFLSATSISPHDFYHPGMLTSSVVLAILLVGFEMLRRKNAFRKMYKFITFIIAASIAFMPSFIELSNYQWIGPLITLVGYNAFNAFMWILLADLTYNFRLSAAATFGIGWGMLTIGATAGQMIGQPLCYAITLTPGTISSIAACGTLIVFAVSLFIMKDNDLVDIKDVKSMVETVGMNSVYDFEETAYAEDTKDAVADRVAASKSGAAQASRDGEAEWQADSSSEDKLNPDGSVRTPFRDRCSALASSCGLTPRETEILILFAKGRSAARIQEDLVISRGTVTTHLQHIYRKTNVHSKQELLDLIESMRD